MASQQQQGQSKDIDPMMVMGGALLAAALAFVLWNKYHTAVATAYAWMRVVQFSPFTLLQSMWSGIAGGIICMGGLTIFIAKKGDKKLARYGLLAVLTGLFLVISYFVGTLFDSWFTFFNESDKSLIEWKHLSKSSLYANVFTLIVVVIPLAVWIARKSLASNPLNHKHFARGRDFSLHSFTDEMANHYPHLKLFRKINLTARSINEGKYRMADTEKQFAIKHGLMDRVKGNEFKINRDRAAEVFKGQMTKLWTHYKHLSRSEFAVMAALIPRIAATDVNMPDAEYKAALKMTESMLVGYWKQAAETYDKDKDTFTLDLALATDAVKRYGGSEKVKRFMKAHAYVGTILYAMLLEARQLGVLQPAEFRWLRVIDRPLWLIIDNVGRLVSVAECGSTYSHFVSEVRQRRAIERPMIDGAVKGLIEAVESFKFSDDEITAINNQITSKEEKAMIDASAVAKETQNLILMIMVIGEGANRDIFEAALLSENGATLYHQRCKTIAPITAAVRERFMLTDADVDGLARLPSSTELRGKLLELCNGHNVITFDKREIAHVAGLDRSAATVVECRGEESFDLVGTAVLEGILDEDKATPVRDAVAAAQLCRLLWVAQRKADLEAQTNRTKEA